MLLPSLRIRPSADPSSVTLTRLVSGALLMTVTAAGLLPVPAAAARSRYHGHCELPRANWSAEVMAAREAAVRECKENQVVRGNDPRAEPPTPRQDAFETLVEQHRALLVHDREVAASEAPAPGPAARPVTAPVRH